MSNKAEMNRTIKGLEIALVSAGARAMVERHRAERFRARLAQQRWPLWRRAALCLGALRLGRWARNRRFV